MKNKEKYRIFCEKNEDIPIYLTDWWMDAVCGEENWDVVLVGEGKDILASLVYYVQKDKLGFLGIMQPVLTPYNGIFINYPLNQKYSSKIGFEKKVMTQLLSEIEKKKLAFYSQQLNPIITNWQPYYWKGYHQTTRYTYVLEDISDLNMLYENCERNIRSNIRKAQSILEVKLDLDYINFYKTNKLSFDRQNEIIPYELKIIGNIFEVCKSKNCGKNFYTVDKDNNIHGVFYIVWDKYYAYCLLSGSNPNLRNSGSNALLLWEAISFISKLNPKLKLDLGGSMLEPVEIFLRAFGGVQKPYFKIEKHYSKKYHWLKTFQGLIKK